jgi:hypothetical protein
MASMTIRQKKALMSVGPCAAHDLMAPSFVRCCITARALGVIKAVQWEQRRRIQSDRLIAVD